VPALLADQVDVALIVKADRLADGVTLTPLFDDEMVAVVARDHPWAERPHVQAGDFDDVHLVLFDSYDPTRVPALPLPLPAGARPARVTTAPVVTELLVEMVATSHDVTVLASWVVEPYLRSHGVRAVRLTATPETRTWSCATRRGDQPPHVETFVELLTAHFGQRSTPHGPTPTRTKTSSPLTAPAP
jgi:LysR family transcriptional regulator, regulator for metE and metH